MKKQLTTTIKQTKNNLLNKLIINYINNITTTLFYETDYPIKNNRNRIFYK
ncbi:hypothetical protein [uncultured Aquimarina sp.]|uniref:hypothetical protein n=1 Tax=uncultured Aquimarina sp. TaxID=575652 RepID=UPI00260BFF96|nr:hypothetical protein [uncultured Aquimarina sp.]